MSDINTILNVHEMPLTEEENELFKTIRSCSDACKKLIEEIIQHYESNSVAESALWDAVLEKRGLSRSKDYVTLDHSTKDVKYCSLIEYEMHKILIKFEERASLKQAILKKLGYETDKAK
jgi:hypothetical protein